MRGSGQQAWLPFEVPRSDLCGHPGRAPVQRPCALRPLQHLAVGVLFVSALEDCTNHLCCAAQCDAFGVGQQAAWQQHCFDASVPKGVVCACTCVIVPLDKQQKACKHVSTLLVWFCQLRGVEMLHRATYNISAIEPVCNLLLLLCRYTGRSPRRASAGDEEWPTVPQQHPAFADMLE